MLIDFRKFEGFLSSLSRITGLRFEIRDENGLVVVSSGAGAEPPTPVDGQALSARVVERSGFQQASISGPRAVFGVPIRQGGEVGGSLIATCQALPGKSPPGGGTHDGGVCPEEMESFLDQMARLVEENGSYQREIEDITDELSRSFEDLHLYSRIATQIKTLRFSDSMLKSLMTEIMDTMRADLAFAELPERKTQNVQVLKPYLAHKFDDRNALVARLVESIPKDAPSLKENYFILNHSVERAAFRRLHAEPYRFLAVKVVHDDQEYGWLGLLSLNLGSIFRQSELRLLSSIAEQVAVIIANTDLYEDLEHFVVNVVKSLVHAIEAKDVYTRGHSERVNLYCMMMADALGLLEQEKQTLHWASILHDVGKIGISEQILNKPGKLTEGEFRSIQDHPTKGFNILKPIEQLAPSLPGLLHHHERYDGKGYPHGLRGEAIPLAARIIAVADTFDAITSTRAYRPAKSSHEALEIIEEVSGSQLDPSLVELFGSLVVEEGVGAEEQSAPRTGTLG